MTAAKARSAKSNILAVVLLAGVLPFLVSLVAGVLFGDAKHVQEPLHEGFELAGTCIALSVAMLLLLQLRHEHGSPHLLWVVAALVAMGIVDGVHSLLRTGVAFSWTRHVATLVGGAIFAQVWLPLPAGVALRKQQFTLLVAALALAGSLAICRWAERSHAPWGTEDGSPLVLAVNALGGLGFLAATVFFMRRYLRGLEAEDLVFVSQTLLFGVSGLFFGFSHVWAADWWVWHGARLLAYSVMLVVAYETVVALYGRIGQHVGELEGRVQERTEALRKLNAELEQRVHERTAQLEATNKELDAFAYSVSHDLRSPLRGVDGYSKLLIEEHAKRLDEDGQFMLGQVRESVQQMRQMIDDLLEFSRLGRQETQLHPCDVGKIVRDLFREMQASHPERRLRLELKELPPCAADPAMIREVVRNLLGNAVKFTGTREEAVVEVGVMECGSHGAMGTAQDAAAPPSHPSNAPGLQHSVTFFVRDNGVGFNPRYQNKLFQVFQRLHRAEDFAGTGIGLALVRRIIERHGGRVWAEGEVDKGATFYFTLPRGK